MKRFPLSLVLALVFFAACSDQPSGPATDSENALGKAAPVDLTDETIDLKDRYIVVFKESVGNVDELVDQMTRGNGSTVHYRYRHALKGFAATIPPQAVEGLRRNPNVAYIEPDGMMYAIATQSPVPSWGLDRIDQTNSSPNNQYVYNNDGTGVTVYIIDTGIRYDHVQFGGRASFEFDAFGGTGADGNGHGTHVAGTVGGNTVGVAKNVALKSVRVLNNQGSGTTSGVIAGINQVAGYHSQYSVANMSLGGGYSSSLNSAVAAAVNSGVTFVVAAGNESTLASTKSPASEASAITVGATASGDAWASYSNYGGVVDILAPGTYIYSAWKNSSTSYNTISGTSMATPHVAGVAALYKAANINATPAQIESALEGAATQNAINGVPSGTPNLLVYSLVAGQSAMPSLTNVHVGVITATSVLTGSKTWTATFTVPVHDASHGPVDGALVTVAYSGGITGTATATSANGVVTFTTPSINTKKASVTLTVTGITGTNLWYQASANHMSAYTQPKP